MKLIVRLCVLAAAVMLMLAAAGCGSGSGAGTRVSSTSTSKGTIAMSVDLQSLLANRPAKSAAAVAPFTAASIEVSRTGYETIAQSMTLVGNVASTRIDNLDPGYWHVIVHVFSNTSEIYTGSTDANILPGVVAQCNVLFDPVDQPLPLTGSLSITAGLNPMPGYTVINQQITKVLHDPAGNKLYIYDATTKTIGVYAADTLVRIKDITLPATPTSLALTATMDKMLLGYASGQIYSLDLSSGASTLLGDVLMDVKNILVLNGTMALVSSSAGNYNTTFKTVDLGTGQILNARTNFFSFGDLVLNQANGTVYTQDVDVSPTDLFRIRIDPTTGTINDLSDGPYHGDYSLAQPLKVIKNGSRVVTSTGTVFSSSAINTQDLLYSGDLGSSYIDLAVDDVKNKLYVLNNGSLHKLLVLNQDSFFLEATTDLLGTPKYVFSTPTKVIVFSSLNSVYYARAFAKSSLGL